MENYDQIRVILNVVRKATKTIKIFPFAYALLMLILLPIASYCNYELALWLGAIFYMSIVMIALLFRLSYIFKLCNWYRLQCALPLLPQILDNIDEYIYQFDGYVFTLDLIVYILIFLLSLVNAYFVFIRPQSS